MTGQYDNLQMRWSRNAHTQLKVYTNEKYIKLNTKPALYIV
jgi:hypothetical protein